MDIMSWFGIPRATNTLSIEEVSFGSSIKPSNRFPGDLISDLPNLRKHGIFFCGGGALSLYLDKSYDSINDFDFWVESEEALKYFKFRLENKYGMHMIIQTDNALTFQSGSGKIQIIIREFLKSYDEIFNTFDFGVCKVGYDGSTFYFGPNTHQQIIEKKLVLEGKTNSDFVKRWFKYSLKGYKMDNMVVAEIIKKEPSINLDHTEDEGY